MHLAPPVMHLASLLAALLLLVPEPNQDPQASTLSAQELADEIDQSVHWLRESQDAAKGGYGD